VLSLRHRWLNVQTTGIPLTARLTYHAM